MNDLPAAEPGFEIVGPFAGQHTALVDGWTVPLIDAYENDGGTFTIIIDQRLAYTIPAGEAENVVRLIADVIAVAWGYGAHGCCSTFENRELGFQRVPHPSLAPHRMFGIGSVEREEIAVDDPRNEP